MSKEAIIEMPVAKEEEKKKTISDLENEYRTMCMQLGNELYSFWLQAESQMTKMQQVNLQGAELKKEEGETK